MIDKKTRRQLQEYVAQSVKPAAAITHVLYALQDYYGYLSDEAVAEAAALTGLSGTEVDELATFYNLLFRRPVGRHILRICDGTCCRLQGGDNLLRFIQKELKLPLGEICLDGALTVLPNICLGLCDHAPAALLDDDDCHSLTEDKLRRIVDRLKTNQPAKGQDHESGTDA